MQVDDGGRWNIVGNTYNGDTWLLSTKKLFRKKLMYIEWMCVLFLGLTNSEGFQ